MTIPNPPAPPELNRRARDLLAKLNGWQPSPLDPVDSVLAAQDIEAAMRMAMFRVLEELEKSSCMLDGDAVKALKARILKGEF